MNIGIIAHNSKKSLIEDFCIAPKWQRKGLGGAFLAEIQRQAAPLGCDSALLATQPDVPAHGFYLKHGFREISIFKDGVVL